MRKHLNLLRMRHEQTYWHSLNVCMLSIDIGYENKIYDKDLIILGYAGLLHDIGKVKIPLEIMTKNAALNESEKNIM